MDGEQDRTDPAELGLDFANTREWRERAEPVEHLPDYAALLAWSVEAGALDAAGAAELAAVAAADPAAADAALAVALGLREALYRLFLTDAPEDADARADLRRLNAALAAGLPHRCLAPAAGGWRWTWDAPGGALTAMLWPVAEAAAQLLTSSQRSLVRACEGEGCGWLFLDTSRNHSRRWCSMEVCGNRAKARRHYQRSKG